MFTNGDTHIMDLRCAELSRERDEAQQLYILLNGFEFAEDFERSCDFVFA